MENKLVKILGIDAASVSTGVGMVNNGKLVKKYSTIVLVDSNSTVQERLYYFGKKLSNILVKAKPDIVVIESTFYKRNIHTLKILSYFAGVAVYCCMDVLNIEPEFMTVKAIRSELGTKNKQETFDYIVKKFKLDWDFKEKNDIADAIAIALAFYNKQKKERK